MKVYENEGFYSAFPEYEGQEPLPDEVSPFTVLGNAVEPWRVPFADNWKDGMPAGWQSLLEQGEQKIAELLEAHPGSMFQVDQLKEKFGGIRLYFSNTSNINEELFAIAGWLEDESYVTCCVCGKPADYYSTGWILPYCKECAEKQFEKSKANWGAKSFDALFRAGD